MSCVFCRIVRGEIPSPRLRETDQAIVIRDIQPNAPVHLLVIPKRHVASLAEGPLPEAELGHLLNLATDAARDAGLLPAGFRTVINTGAGGGQTVFHLHVHVLGDPARGLSGRLV